MEREASNLAPKWGDLLSNTYGIATSWRRRSKSEQQPGSGTEDQSSDVAVNPSPDPWQGKAELETSSAVADEVQRPNPEVLAENVASEEAKSQHRSSFMNWGDMLPSVAWRGKSESVEQVQQEHESTDSKGKAKVDGPETASSQVPATTWGEMIHPALKPSHWRRKSREEGEVPQVNRDSEATVEDAVDDAIKNTGDEVPQAVQGTLSAVAASIRRSITGMSRWSMGDLTLGLYKLSGRHMLEGAADTIDGTPVSSIDELRELLHWFHWAYAAYKKDKQKLAIELEVEESQIVKHVITSAILKPAYFIAVDPVRRCVVMSIRGTLAATDVLTDLNPHSEEFEGGFAHSGMLAAARWLVDNETTTLQDVLAANPEFRLVLVGHSLGAGTAALVCMLLREYDSKRAGPLSRLCIPASWITCWGYGCPPCLDKRLAEEAGVIKSIVLQDDVVARVTPAALEELRKEILDTDWSQVFKDGSKGKKMLELAQSTYSALPLAKTCGSVALSVAKTGALAGPTIHKAANWFSVGIAAVELLNAATSHRSRDASYASVPDGEGTQVTAATVAVNMAETAESTTDALEMQRLYVPGVLYHILRKPLQASTSTEISVAPAVDDPGSPSKKKVQVPQFEHIVIRGDDPSSRFKRIVLSSTLLSDHGCVQYNEALVDSIRWASRR